VTFVLATIKCDLPTAVLATRAVVTNSGDQSAVKRAFFGFKLKGLEFLGTAKAHEVYKRASFEAKRDSIGLTTSDEILLEELLAIPGLGLAKAGFLAQLCWGRIGCLDTHNLRRLGIDPKAVTVGAKPKTPKGVQGYRRRIDTYVSTCRFVGGSEVLWDDWCTYVADRQPKRYDGAEDVSAWHLQALGLAR
jgi:hypothetical protein